MAGFCDPAQVGTERGAEPLAWGGSRGSTWRGAMAGARAGSSVVRTCKGPHRTDEAAAAVDHLVRVAVAVAVAVGVSTVQQEVD
ncbi:hypothetical protein ACWPOB_03435 [Rhodococcus sp. 2H158]